MFFSCLCTNVTVLIFRETLQDSLKEDLLSKLQLPKLISLIKKVQDSDIELTLHGQPVNWESTLGLAMAAFGSKALSQDDFDQLGQVIHLMDTMPRGVLLQKLVTYQAIKDMPTVDQAQAQHRKCLTALNQAWKYWC